MTTEAEATPAEVKPFDFTTIEGLLSKLNPNEVDPEWQIGRTSLNDGTYIQIIREVRFGRLPGNREESEVIFEVGIGSSPVPYDLRFELAEGGLRSLRQRSVDIKREPFAFDVSIGESPVGRWWIHDKTKTLDLNWISNPLEPIKEAHIKAGELMIDWLQSIIDNDSFSEPPINLSLVDPKLLTTQTSDSV